MSYKKLIPLLAVSIRATKVEVLVTHKEEIDEDGNKKKIKKSFSTDSKILIGAGISIVSIILLSKLDFFINKIWK